MKRKFLILTLCFTIVFTSINYKKSYADGGVLSAPMLATVTSLAVGSGILIKGNSDVYDLGRMFVDYVNRHNSMTMTALQSSFALCHSVLSNGIVSVKESPFLDFVKEFFDTTFTDSVASSGSIKVNRFGIPSWENPYIYKFNHEQYNYFTVGDISFSFTYVSDKKYNLKVSYKDNIYDYPYKISISDSTSKLYISNMADDKSVAINIIKPSSGTTLYEGFKYSVLTSLSSTVSFPYTGGYTWDNVESKKENNSIALPIPGDLGSLVGQTSDKFWDNTDNLVGTGSISIPSVNNPSISVENDVFIGDLDVPDVDVPDVDVPGTDTIVPSFPSFGDSLDFSPMYLSNVTEKFPFSLPWDIGRLIQKFDVDPKAPVFEVPVFSETITLDLTEFDELASIVRFFVLIGFVLSLIFISTRLLG